MPATIKAQRIQICKRRFDTLRDEKPCTTAEERAAAQAVRFQRRWNALHEMLGIKTLSRVNQRWAKKAIVKMREEYPDAESQRMIGLLDDRVNRAIDRLIERDAKRAVAKATGISTKKEPTTTLLDPDAVDVWSLL